MDEFTLDSTTRYLTVVLSAIGVVLVVIALKKLLSLKEKISHGWSTLFFLGTDWIYASPNRNYLIGGAFAFASAYITGLFAYLAILGTDLPEYSIYSIIPAIILMVLGGFALRKVQNKE